MVEPGGERPGRELRGADRVREVFARVHAGDEGAADLYVEDGHILVAGQRVEGREAIRAFYRATIERIHPKPSVLSVMASLPHYAVLVDVPTSEGHQRALDLFEVGDDGIHWLEIYARP